MTASMLLESKPAGRCDHRGCWLEVCEEAENFGWQLCAGHWLAAAKKRMDEIVEIDGEEFPDSPYIADAREELSAARKAAEGEWI